MGFLVELKSLQFSANLLIWLSYTQTEIGECLMSRQSPLTRTLDIIREVTSLRQSDVRVVEGGKHHKIFYGDRLLAVAQRGSVSPRWEMNQRSTIRGMWKNLTQ